MSQLEFKTRQYWSVSKQYNGKGIPAGVALDTLRAVLTDLNPSRTLAKLANDMKWEIIKGPEHESVNEATANSP